MSFSLLRLLLIPSIFAVLVSVGCASNDGAAGAAGTGGTAGSAGAAGSVGGYGGTSGAGDAHGGSGDSVDASTSGGAGGAEDATRSYVCGSMSAPSGSGGMSAGGVAGEGGADTSSAAALTCVVGQTFCYIFAALPPQPGPDRVLIPQCRSVEEGAAACADAPTCACLCSSGRFHCETECRCQEHNGLPTMTCDQI